MIYKCFNSFMAGTYFTKDNLYEIIDKGGENFYIKRYDNIGMGHELKRVWFNYALPGILIPYHYNWGRLRICYINKNITIL
jgi:hypothetical protein